MPAAAPIIIGAALNAATAYAVVGVTLAVAAKIFFASVALGLIQQSFNKQRRGDTFSSPRTITVRDARAARRLVVGRAIIGGTILYATTTDNDRHLHLVIALCDGPVDGFGTVWLDGNAISPDAIDADGFVQFGRFAGVARLKFHNGDAPQTADADLVAAVAEWTAAHRLDGIAYLYADLTRDETAFPTGAPNPKVEIYGRAWFDPRDSITRWTPNATLVQRGWVGDADWGLGAPGAEIDDTVAQASANTCDEMVPVQQATDTFEARLSAGWLTRETSDIPLLDSAGLRVTFTTTGALPAPLQAGVTYWVTGTRSLQDKAGGGSKSSFRVRLSGATGPFVVLLDTGTGVHTMSHTEIRRNKDDGDTITITTDVVEAAPSSDRLIRTEATIAWQVADRITFSTTDTLPSPLAPATDYYVIPGTWPDFKVASTFADARSRTPIALTDTGTGDHSVTRTAEPRYTCNGIIQASTDRGAVFQALLASSSARPVWTGVWRIGVGAAKTSVASLAEADLIGPIKARTRVPRSERFNAIGGAMYDSATGELVDYPQLASSAFRTADGGELIEKTFNLGFTDSASMAQRLVKIELLRSRQEIAVELIATMKALPIVADEWFDLTFANWGWAAKNFEAEQWQITSQDGGAAPLLTVRIAGHEIDASVFDWATSEEQLVDPAPNTTLPNPFDLPAPMGLGVVEELYETRGGAGVKARAILTWAAPDNGFVDRGGSYRVEARFEAETIWTPLGEPFQEEFVVDDIAPGNWEFKVNAISRLGGESEFSPPFLVEILGLLAPPATPTGVSVQTIGAMAILTWDRHPDLDVRMGGRIRIRWSPAFTGATWQGSTEVTDPAAPPAGDTTQYTAPLRDGSYLVRAYDSSGIPSVDVAIVSTRAAEHLVFTSLGTITESPTFPGTHSGTVSVGGILKLTAAGLFDDIPDFDAVSSLDSYGGIGSTGTYGFSAGFDFGSVKTVRITANVTAQAINALALIDDRTTNIDDWEDFDGTFSADGDLQVRVRETDDDPAASPVWGDWMRLTAADRNARGMEFEAVLTVADMAYNEHCTALSVTAQEIA